MQFKAPLVAALFSGLAVATSTSTGSSAAATSAASGTGSAAASSVTLAPSAEKSILGVAAALSSRLPSSIQKELSTITDPAEVLSVLTPLESSSAWISGLPSSLQSWVTSELAEAAPTGGSGSKTTGSGATSTGGAAATGVGMGLAGAAGILGVAFAL